VCATRAVGNAPRDLHGAPHGVPGAAYQQVFNQMYADGFRPIRLSGYPTPNGTEFAGIWIADGVTEWRAHHGLDRSAFDDRVAQLADDHYYPIDLSAYEEQGQAKFAGIWQRSAGSRPEVRVDLDQMQYQIGGDTAAARKPDEVTYYGVAGDQDPYAVHISRDDGASGWIATAIDLLRFLRVVDGRGVDVLNAASRSRMRWPSPDPELRAGVGHFRNCRNVDVQWRASRLRRRASPAP
jgi:hypothetical protein